MTAEPEPLLDLEDEPISLDGCQCDMDEPCNDARCQMERDLEMRRMFALYRRGALDPPRDLQRQMYVDVMIDAGREHLLRDDERI